MTNYTSGPGRKELALNTKAQRDELARQKATGALVIDERRTRPRYFDGRFLAARDLKREQDYFLARQADLGLAGGVGVAHGLMASQGSATNTISITAGHGITTSGEMVMLSTDREINLSDLTHADLLNSALGLLKQPHESALTLSGVFTLALRPLEYTAHPIASYPTSLTGARSVQEGDIIEATMVTLIPYPDTGVDSAPENVRKRVARSVFLADGSQTVPAGALPLALLLLNRGVIEWIDPFLARREIGVEHSATLGLGFAPRALREAHLLQYDQHLQDVIQTRIEAQQSARFAASDYFALLPPAGPMPAAALDPDAFTQIYFPPDIDTDLSIVPDDEINALIEDSFSLPPIDLTLTGDALASTSVLVLIAVPRQNVRALQTQLTAVSRRLVSAAPNLIARRKPLEILSGLRLPPLIAPPALPASGGTPTPGDAAWSNLLRSATTLWYIRRRNLQYRGDVTGLPVP